MKIFDFFKRKKKMVSTTKYHPRNKEQVKQGFYREREYIIPNSNFTQNKSEFLMTLEGEYKDGVRVGRWKVKDKDGNEGYTNYNEYGQKDGLEKSPNGTYTLYSHGQRIKLHYELMREWKRRLKEGKIAKEGDEDNRSNTLKDVLEAKTKEAKMEVLRKFHASKTAKGHVRRTALKFGNDGPEV